LASGADGLLKSTRLWENLASVANSTEHVLQLQVKTWCARTLLRGRAPEQADTRGDYDCFCANALAKDLAWRPPRGNALQNVKCEIHPLIPSQGAGGAAETLRRSRIAHAYWMKRPARSSAEKCGRGEAIKRGGITPVALEGERGTSLLHGTQGMLTLLSLACLKRTILVSRM